MYLIIMTDTHQNPAKTDLFVELIDIIRIICDENKIWCKWKR